MTGNDGQRSLPPLIAPKPFSEFSPEEYWNYVRSMYEIRKKSGVKQSLVEGISLSRTKKGVLSVRFSSKKRAFRYVLEEEVQRLAQHMACPFSEMWNLFRAKDFIVAKTRIEAEQINARITEIPWK